MIRSPLWKRSPVVLVISAFLAGCSGQPAAGPTGPGDPASVTITTPASTLVAIGATLQLNATVQNSTTAASWSSNLPGVVSVSATGVATAVANGTAVITASVAGASATVPITVQQVATSLAVSPAPVTVNSLEAQVQLAGTATDANGSAVSGAAIAWSSADPAIATVNATSGLVTSKANGTTTITAVLTGTPAITATATVTVNQTIASFNVTPSTLSFASLQDTGQLTAVAVDANNNPVAGAAATQWLSIDPAVVTVDAATGLVTSKANGTTTVRATLSGITRDVAVAVQQVVASVVVTPSALTIAGGLGDSGQLTASALDAKGNAVASATLVWSSGDAGLATVSTNGLVTAAVREGGTSISASAGGTSAQASVTITDPPGPFKIETGRDFVTVAPGRTGTVPVTAFDQDTGAGVAFTASGAACVSNVVVGAGQVTFTFAGSPTSVCDLQIQAQGLTKTVQVRGYDPMEMDLGGGLSMTYTNKFTYLWNNDPAASNDWYGGGARGTAWRPVAPVGTTGWYPVGDHFDTRAGSGTYSYLIDPAGDVPMVLLRDDTGQNLRAPTGYTQIWNSYDDGCAIVCPSRPAIAWVWKPTCPVGFVALGSVATNTSAAPSTDAVRCVAASRTTPGKIGRQVFTDAGSGSDGDLAIYTVGDPTSLQARTDGKVPMWTRAMVACPSYTAAFPSCDAATFNLLLITPQVMEAGGTQRIAALTDWARMPDVQNSARRVRFPFTLIKSQDPERNGTDRTRVKDNAEGRPFYYVETVLTTKQVAEFNNRCLTTPTPVTYSTTKSAFTTSASTFSQEYGIKVGIQGEVGFLGTGTEVSAEISATFNWTTSTSTGFGSETTTSQTVTAPPRYYVAIVGTLTEFFVFDEFNNALGSSIESEGPNLQGLQYTAANWKNSPSCGI